MKEKYCEINLDRVIIMNKISEIFAYSKDLQMILFDELMNSYKKYDIENLSESDFIKVALNVALVFSYTNRSGECFVPFQFKHPKVQIEIDNTDLVLSSNFILSFFSKLKELEKIVLFCYLSHISTENIGNILGVKQDEIVNLVESLTTMSEDRELNKLKDKWQDWSQNIRMTLKDNCIVDNVLQNDCHCLFFQIGGVLSIGVFSLLIYKYLLGIQINNGSKYYCIIGALLALLSVICVFYYISYNFIFKYNLKISSRIMQTIDELHNIVFKSLMSRRLLWFSLPTAYWGIVFLEDILSNPTNTLKVISLGIMLFIIAIRKYFILNKKI